MFKKKLDESALVYPRSATELDLMALFGPYPLIIAVAACSRIDGGPEPAEPSCEAHGVQHQEFFSHQPFLPVAVQFVRQAAPQSYRPGGWGSVSLGHTHPPHYRCDIVVWDQDGRLFDALQRAMAHAAASRQNFVHIHLGRRREDLPGEDGMSPDDRSRQRRLELEALAARVDAQATTFPTLHFDWVSITDRIELPAPGWARLWRDATNLLRPAFLSRTMAETRQHSARKLEQDRQGRP